MEQKQRNAVVEMFEMAVEGGSNYWCSEIDPVGKAKDEDYAKGMLKGFTATDKLNRFRKYTIDPMMIRHAFSNFARLAPIQYKNFLNDNMDAEDGDVFLQLCVFGKVIYG